MNEKQIETEVRWMVTEFPAPGPGFEDRVLSAVPAERPRRGQSWAITVAAVLAIAIVATLVLGARLFGGHSPTPAAPRTAGPRFVYLESSFPDSTLVYADWSGKVVARRSVGFGTIYGASPDGSLVRASRGNATVLLSANGSVVAQLQSSSWIWADDSRHACMLDKQAGNIEYGTVGPAGFQFTAVHISGEPRSLASALMSVCSAQTGRLVITGSFAGCANCANGAGLAFVSVIDVRTGRVTYHHDYDGVGAPRALDGAMLSLSGLWLSPDGRYAAESDPTATTSRVRDLTSGALGDTLLGAGRGFSGDDSRLILVQGGGTPAAVTQVVEWRTDRIVWSHAGNDGEWLARPGGKELALTLTLRNGNEIIFVVPARGAAVQVAQVAAAKTIQGLHLQLVTIFRS
jgi:hypothetical protein